jgi:hypothetical protein
MGLVDQKNSIYSDGHRGHFVSRKRAHEVRRFLPAHGPNHGVVVTGFHRSGELPYYDTMFTALAGPLHIARQIVIIDCDLDRISLFPFWRSLSFSHAQRDEPGLSLTHVRPCLAASDFVNRTMQPAVVGQKPGISPGYLTCGRSDGFREDRPHGEAGKSP